MLLCAILVYVGSFIERYQVKDMNLDYLRHGLYPTLKADSRGEYGVTFEDIIDQIDVVEPFMVNGGVGFDGGYDPLTDALGPMNFFPVHCMPIESRSIYASPVVATISQSNDIQRKMKDQILTHFNAMSKLLQTIKNDELLSSLIETTVGALDDLTVLVEIEAILKTVDSFINLWSGENR
jgi:hypothetical protein